MFFFFLIFRPISGPISNHFRLNRATAVKKFRQETRMQLHPGRTACPPPSPMRVRQRKWRTRASFAYRPSNTLLQKGNYY